MYIVRGFKRRNAMQLEISWNIVRPIDDVMPHVSTCSTTSEATSSWNLTSYVLYHDNKDQMSKQSPASPAHIWIYLNNIVASQQRRWKFSIANAIWRSPGACRYVFRLWRGLMKPLRLISTPSGVFLDALDDAMQYNAISNFHGNVGRLTSLICRCLNLQVLNDQRWYYFTGTYMFEDIWGYELLEFELVIQMSNDGCSQGVCLLGQYWWMAADTQRLRSFQTGECGSKRSVTRNIGTYILLRNSSVLVYCNGRCRFSTNALDILPSPCCTRE